MKRDRRGRFLAAPGGPRAPPAPRRTPGTAARGTEPAEPPAAASCAPEAAGAGDKRGLQRLRCPGTAGGTQGTHKRGAQPPKTLPQQVLPCPTAVTTPAASGIGRALSTGYCRLCHGKFSSRSLRNAFGKVPVLGENSEKQRRVDQVFFADFQRLVGVAVRQDPALPQFVCKKCHAQFYKCRSVLRTFIQRVNASPTGHAKSKGKSSGVQAQPGVEGGASCLVDLITSSPQCLHSLVTWTHAHAGSCASVPGLRSVLSSEYCGIIRAVWGCGDGHDYVMDTDSDCSSVLLDNALTVKREWSKGAAQQRLTDNGAGADDAEAVPAPKAQHAPIRTAPCQQPANKGTAAVPLNVENEAPQDRAPSPSQLDSAASVREQAVPQPVSPLSTATGQLSGKQVLSATSDERVKDEFSDLSEGDFLSDDESEKRNVQSSDDSFEPYPEKKVSGKKSDSKEAKKVEEPKIRKKPGPKPGWKKKIKCEREELPTIYKCPYQGCTAVYRGADGMKKHIKEHHEEVRERPCPHPGCNKVFMIDRYLQRHVKLIHTEVRNYICDECGQTFKQRKHLSVHQMRHSGAKPLQCEICGFQCRQRASLKYHMTKHKAEAELEFACDQCGKRFEKAHNLNVHMSMVHPLTQTQDKAKPLEPEPILLLTTSGTAEGQAVKPEVTAQPEPT